MKTSFYQHTFADLNALWQNQGLSAESASLAFNWFYKKARQQPCSAHNLARRTREFLEQEMDFALPSIHTLQQSDDGTVKFLFALQDGQKIETVLIPFQNKYTVCLSSQVGCAMACTFCFTGDQGFQRQLRTEEIVGQLLQVKLWLRQNRPTADRILNLVYMGQGEPLHNFTAVQKSAEIFISQHGLSLAGHKITVSTSGYAPGLRRWKGEMPDVNIALSLHSPFTEKRNELIPINRRYPLEEILPLVDAIPTGKKRFVTYEYLLLKDFNDGLDDAHATGALLQGKKAMVNLIPFNPYPGAKYQRPASEAILKFKAILESYKVVTLVRTTKGSEILAACGQLNSDSYL